MTVEKLKLGVNIDHVATIREARGVDYPDIAAAAQMCQEAGANGITIHLREDRRHIQDGDLKALKAVVITRMNLEMANVDEIVQIAIDTGPEEVCLVPERREELTTEGGLDVSGAPATLGPNVERMATSGIEVSLFVDPDEKQLSACRDLAVPYVELHTGAFCNAAGEESDKELDRLVKAAVYAHDLGIKVNAGHGINIDNITRILEIPFLDTLNIGHSIVARAVFVGLSKAVDEILAAMSKYDGGRK